MPHTNINSAGSDDIRAKVAWGPDFVQVATGMVEHKPAGEAGPAHDVFDPAAHVTLDRAGCNRAIKAIRNARDQAYGRDE